MNTPSHNEILIIGSGNMGLPVIASAIRCNSGHITVITGASGGKTSPKKTREYLTSEGVDVADVTFIARDKLAEATLPAPNIAIYCTKPSEFNDVTKALGAALSSAETIISIATAPDSAAFQSWNPQATVIRSMPSLVKKVQGIYAAESTPKATLEMAEALLVGLGTPLHLPNEGVAFQNFAVHAGCGPAFVAQFIARIGEAFPDLPNAQTLAKEHLNDWAKNIETKTENALYHQTQKFYDHWLKLAEADLGAKNGGDILSQTILGTIEYLDIHPKISPAGFANQVRSAKGVTNAGLLCMGSPLPAQDRFGSESEREEQNTLAQTFKSRFQIEDTIVPAIIAAKQRAASMAAHPNTPLAGLDYQAIEAQACVIISPQKSGNGLG